MIRGSTDGFPIMTAAQHAVQTLLWSSSDGDHEGLEEFDASPELIAQVTADWESFCQQAEVLGFDAVEHRATAINSAEGDEWDYAAHDFILTRNGHGAGFWDGDWQQPWGDQLTALCRSFGEIGCYLGDDGLVYA